MQSILSKISLLVVLLLTVGQLSAQSTLRTGSIQDQEGTPLIGASILLEGTSTGAITDLDGNFSITASPDDVLLISYTGYATQRITVGSSTNLPIVLETDSEMLEEIVVIGYGVQQKRDVTGAVSAIKSDDLDKTNAVTIDNMLQGKAAGLNITAPTAQPGGALSINIRGAISPNGDNSPLYVIDGLPISNNSSTEFNSTTGNFRGGFARSPLANINPNDIESIDVLKDASATAIYGSAAANGVILITTKKGSEGRTSINYSGTYSLQTPKDFIQPLNAQQFRENANLFAEEQYRFNNGIAPYGTGTDISGFTPFFTEEQLANVPESTDYLGLLLRNGTISDHNISVTAGTSKTKLFTSFNFYDQAALLKGSNFSRLSGRINLDQSFGERVTFSLGATYNVVKADNVATGQVGDIDSPSLLQSALQFAPDVPARTETGGFSSGYYTRTPNPLSFLEITNQNNSTRLLLTPKLKVEVTDWLDFNLTGGIDNTATERRFFVPVSAGFPTVPQGNGQLGNTKLNNYSTEGYLSFRKQFTDSRISAIVGAGFYRNTFTDFFLNAVGFSTDAFGLDNVGIAFNREQSSVGSNRTARNKLSQFNRINYTLKEKYIFQFTGRVDATSNFPEENAYGFFPGVSAGWLINEESFMDNLKWLNRLKLRAGYGTSGNESITANNNYASSLYSLTGAYRYLIGGQLFNTGFVQSQIGNPELKWETNVTINLGLDFSLFKGQRITGSLDYFRRTANDLLDFRVLPSSNAITLQAFNVGSTRSTGVEMTLRTQNVVSEKFNWSTLLTLGTARSTWVTRNPAVELEPYVKVDDPIRAQYGWRTNGLIRVGDEIPDHQPNAVPGNIRYVDLNDDGVLDINDVDYIGNYDPKGTFGLSNNLSYGNFDVSINIYGAYGQLTGDAFQSFVEPFTLTRAGAPTNVEVNTLNIFTSFNPEGIYPGFAVDVAAANNPSGANDYRFVENSYFARLKDINIGYQIPTQGIKAIQSARVFLNFNNLGFLTNIEGYDPEMERNNNPYPTALTTAFGVNLSF
ncbi:TonB-dependent receptor [Lewinella sp. 4G2]|uniref:SusC/RagA family TonB-linked outer membrane protein n=1 Tax=Lewinella sp. 4G2 TaxID=1803372 RepID=UPI0007B4F0E6|nr:TonB-dependent receptor [Lewinella sp. 4G2]OAV45290.1 hypothetical protein A3850_012650 [Lewinella sp. 4G2]